MHASFIRLGVNIDHTATVRQARYRDYTRQCGEIIEPDPLVFALAAERAGADGITVHPREDGRHVQPDDVRRIREAIQVPLNLEMACTARMIEFALAIRPNTVCLVPEKREEVTTEGGLDVAGQFDRVKEVVDALAPAGIGVSLFIAPEEAQIQCAADLKVEYIELHTGAFANAWHDRKLRAIELEKIQFGARFGQSLGLTVNLGHGINYTNIVDLRTIPGIYEMNIGHTIIARALITGAEEAVREMKARMRPGF